jgi:osmoprotectant transport system permease protein
MDLIGGIVAWFADPAHWQGQAGVPTRVAEHLGLTAASLLIAALIALPMGLAVGHTGRGVAAAVNIANLGRAMPTLATMGIVLPLTVAIDPQFGFKILPALIALVALAIPPILVNAFAGVNGVDRDVVEAGRGMGMRARELLLRVEIPIALPVIVAGIRSGAVQIIATATLAAVFGGPGLGRYLVEGNAQSDYPMIFAGVILVAVLSLASELVFALLQRAFTSPGVRREPPSDPRVVPAEDQMSSTGAAT